MALNSVSHWMEEIECIEVDILNCTSYLSCSFVALLASETGASLLASDRA